MFGQLCRFARKFSLKLLRIREDALYIPQKFGHFCVENAIPYFQNSRYNHRQNGTSSQCRRISNSRQQDYGAMCAHRNHWKGGETMTLDAMTQVTQAEAQAKSSMQDASTASKQIIADADAKGKAYQAEKEAQAAAAVKEMMRNAEARAAENAEEIMHHAENQCAVLRAHAESRLDAAANSIVERIVID